MDATQLADLITDELRVVEAIPYLPAGESARLMAAYREKRPAA